MYMRSRLKDLEKNIKYMTVDLTSRKEIEEEKKKKEKTNRLFLVLFMMLAAFFIVAGLFILPYGWVLIIGGVFIFIWGLLITFM